MNGSHYDASSDNRKKSYDLPSALQCSTTTIGSSNERKLLKAYGMSNDLTSALSTNIFLYSYSVC
jgi:hypothetical protein